MPTGKPAAQIEEAMELHRRGDVGAAAALYRKIIDADPANADAWQLLGVVARQMGKTDLALRLIAEALKLNPRHAPALANHALLLREGGDLDAARKQAEAAVEADRHYPEAHTALAGALQAQRDFAGALRHYEIAALRKTGDPDLYNNIAIARQRLGLLAEAYDAVAQALKLKPGLARLHHTRGNILRAAGYPDLACDAFAEALRLDPGLKETEVNAAMTHLLIGDFPRGWELFDRRGKADARHESLTRWRGEKNASIHLLIHAEQGLGDTIQFSRLVFWARGHIGRIILEVQKPLRSLIAASFPDMDVIASEDDIPAGATHHCRLLDIAGMMALDGGNIPGAVPYIKAPPLAEPPRLLLAGRKKPVIGLVWAGNPGHLNDANRSLKLQQLAPALSPFAAHMVSLQKGPQAEELASSGLDIADGGALLDDFSATAAMLDGIDLLISVDTSVAHLAGALGRPVWVMLPYDPDWRWLLERQDAPWYPSARLYRQAAPGDWAEPLGNMAGDLAAFIGGDPSVLQPTVWDHLPARRPRTPLKLPGLDAGESS
ncbi:MAG: tetratricopeptide repeat protein [Alphaproteobacteria bacterium]